MADPTLTDTRFATARPDLVEAANKAGIDSGLLVKIAGFESGFNPHARPIAGAARAELNTITQFDGTKAMSTAYGYGQFLNATWGDMVRQHGEKYGIEHASEMTNAQANTAAMRENTKLQAGLLAEFTKVNMEKGAALGGKDAAANVYAMHNLGGSDGPAFLKALAAHPDARVDSVLSGTVVERNSSLYGDGSITLAKAYQNMGAQMEHYAKYANEASQAQAQSPAGVAAQAAPVATQAAVADKAADSAAPVAVDLHGGVLREGARGTNVRALQEQLSELGYKDAQGHALKPDAHFGGATKAAVEAFQEKNHLAVDGVVGETTLTQMQAQLARQHAAAGQVGEQQASSPVPSQASEPIEMKKSLLSDERHPDNPMFQQALSGMQKVDEEQGRKPDQLTANVSGALVAEARARGMDRIDYVVLSNDGTRAWAVQGNPNDPYKRYADVDLSQAVNQSVEQSSANWDRVVGQQAGVGQGVQQVQQVQGGQEQQAQAQGAGMVR